MRSEPVPVSSSSRVDFGGVPMLENRTTAAGTEPSRAKECSSADRFNCSSHVGDRPTVPSPANRRPMATILRLLLSWSFCFTLGCFDLGCTVGTVDTVDTLAADGTPHQPAGHLPREALDLLRRSLADPCQICAEGFRQDAFELLSDFYYPGLRLQGSDPPLFAHLPGPEGELVLTTSATADTLITFRYHSTDHRLIGISLEDLTDPAILEKLAALPTGQVFGGELEVVSYPYGNGGSFLFSPKQGRLQIQCKILRLDD